MSDVQNAAQAGAQTDEQRLMELRVSASMMRLDAGLYCVVVNPSPAADAQTGLPGLRITQAPGLAGRPEAVTVRTLSDDGWMTGFGDAALVRVTGGPAFVLLTIYQAPGHGSENAPHLQVLPLMGDVARPAAQLAAPAAALPAAEASAALPPPAAPQVVDVVAHIQTRGDVGARFGEWLGERGSKHWIEGFGIAPSQGIAPSDIEYQVVLGRGWLSPWAEGGQYCGSRGMALPILGLRARLRGAAAEAFSLRYSASFLDGTMVGPVAAGEPCETESLAAVEAMLFEITPIGTPFPEPAPAAQDRAAPGEAPAAKPKARAKPAAKPSAKSS
jgi:hypothetical protein